MSTPALPAGLQDLGIDDGVKSTRFPAPSKQAAGLVNGTPTDVSSVYFGDKILITISQEGRLSQWIQVPLSSASPTTFDTALPSDNEDMLPLGHLTPKTLLGAGGEQRETLGHLYASQIASVIATRNPDETRTVVVGLGLQKVDMEREAFFDLLELLQKVI
ncbi:hypothetical protein V8E51_010989 [Hyaloscypha variabilis]|uniref:Uncharacterized protein n=1 Tax=Hyaloscypha variabilis (strain UAMH 11265 / GT02V1 / F) TaxID=1149755 RepID=A0A2J6RWV8_HYAVF|nr:hypothetical protein L207DRAFT_631175 [Hyaloscypha variabilis F]